MTLLSLVYGCSLCNSAPQEVPHSYSHHTLIACVFTSNAHRHCGHTVALSVSGPVLPGDGSWDYPHSTSTTTLVRSRGPLRPASLRPAWPVGCAWVCKGPQAYSRSKMSVTLFTFRPMGSVVKGFLKSGPESALANFQGSPAPMERRTRGFLGDCG